MERRFLHTKKARKNENQRIKKVVLSIRSHLKVSFSSKIVNK